ncbi:MAG TPA: L,D-transpeptidase [Thermoanaerobaculia bacterium]|jgi:L,D-transpeptidase YbiS
MKIAPELQQVYGRDRALRPEDSFAFEPPRRLPVWARAFFFVVAAGVVLGSGAALGLARYGGAYASAELRFDPAPPPELSELTVTPAERAAQLEKRLTTLAPKREIYIVVDSYRNRLRVYKGDELLREAVCSTGSGVRLRDPRNGKEWIFDTPQGEVRIWRKRRDPVWVKPDWAFIEEGFEPPRGMRDRVDDYSLGDYALDMPDGYLIHGTVFKTLLGRRVTHGCIRLGDEDLEFAYKTVPVGARVFLF